MSIDNTDYYYEYYWGNRYYSGYMQASWTFVVYFPLMIWGWFIAISQFCVLCKMKKWEQTGGVNMRSELMYQQIPQQPQMGH
jgi:hypothetical protein